MRLKHDESIFFQIDGDVYILCAQEKHHDRCPQSFQLQNDTNFTTNLHSEL